MAAFLRQRLLLDIAELQTRPYPNITLYIDEQNLTRACLVLNAEYYGLLHLSVKFPERYPLEPPSIVMDSQIQHPNIYGGYICASILNTKEGYTSAYTLKGIAIQLLSFFSSESVEQVGGYRSVNLAEHRKKRQMSSYNRVQPREYRCANCPFGCENETIAAPLPLMDSKGISQTTPMVSLNKQQGTLFTPIKSEKIADEIFLTIFSFLETEDLMQLAKSYKKFGLLVTRYDIIRSRELQCFCLKKDYKEVKLGVGVNYVDSGRFPTYESE